MIKTALKHWIYEICIEQLFNGIYKNFNSASKKFKVGDRFAYIDMCYVLLNNHYVDRYYGDVVITDMVLNGNFAIKFKYISSYSNKGNKNLRGTMHVDYYNNKRLNQIYVKTYEEYMSERGMPKQIWIHLDSMGRYKKYD